MSELVSRLPSTQSVNTHPCELSDRRVPRMTTDNVLPFYLRKADEGQRVCLVTVYQVDTVAPRPVGSQIAVSENGESFGFITGGCAESAIVHEALMALNENKSRTIRIGSESPWFDIKLPCGAGIDLHFSVADSRESIREACELLANRKAVELQIDIVRDRIGMKLSPTQNEQSRGPHLTANLFRRSYNPNCQLAIIGAGPYVDALSQLGTQSEFDVAIWSPEPGSPHLENRKDATARTPLTRSLEFSADFMDRWTAAVLLFHEHDWEPKLLKKLLESDCFYIGALGSRRTHANRIQQLRSMGIEDFKLRKIHGPVGLDIGAKSPAEIAISILAEIVQKKNNPHLHANETG